MKDLWVRQALLVAVLNALCSGVCIPAETPATALPGRLREIVGEALQRSRRVAHASRSR